VNWRALETASPELARRGRERLEEARVALLGTVRKDGSPRISPVEPYLADPDLLIGAMSWSLKTRDLRRDARCVLHSAVTGPDAGEGELRLYGRAVEASAAARERCSEGWWHRLPAADAAVFTLEIEEATFIAWDVRRGRMTVHRWSPGRGATVTERGYP